MVASDNTRDPFYAYGDLDMLEVYREATRILQFDHSERPWMKTVAATPGEMMGLPNGRMAVGAPAGLVLDARADDERVLVASADGPRGAMRGEAGGSDAAGLSRVGLKEPVFFHRRFSLSVDKLRMI